VRQVRLGADGQSFGPFPRISVSLATLTPPDFRTSDIARSFDKSGHPGEHPIMSVKVYGCNHVAIEVDDVEKAVSFYQDVFNLQKLDEGEGDAFFKLGEHQFLAMFKVDKMKSDRMRHFGIMVRDEAQLAEVRTKITKKYGLKLIPGFRCDFRDPFGNRIQVVDLHDESLVWLLPYQEVQKVGIKFDAEPCQSRREKGF
jgi:catechol 2,3-dioxygenase-like lactoylglutathione lyase family enzyme